MARYYCRRHPDVKVVVNERLGISFCPVCGGKRGANALGWIPVGWPA